MMAALAIHFVRGMACGQKCCAPRALPCSANSRSLTNPDQHQTKADSATKPGASRKFPIARPACFIVRQIAGWRVAAMQTIQVARFPHAMNSGLYLTTLRQKNTEYPVAASFLRQQAARWRCRALQAQQQPWCKIPAAVFRLPGSAQPAWCGSQKAVGQKQRPAHRARPCCM